MIEELIDFNLPENDQSIIMVIGMGGGGNNAVNRMYEEGIRDVDFMVANTDSQALFGSPVPRKIQLGTTLTEGRGAGSRADIGEQAAIESIGEIRDVLSQHTRMAFLVAGMGGGTGTGAAPIVAKTCRELGILTVGVVTLPFRFEGPKRLRMAIQGINRLKQEVDALLIIHNEKLREIYGNKPISVAFANADEILMLAVKGIAEIITIHGYINVDFADVMSVMKDGGIAFMGSATTSGADRAKRVINETVNSPLLNNNDIKGASRVLLNITSGQDEITVDEIGVITDVITEKVGGRVNTIWGTCTDESLTDAIRITLVATGFKDDAIPEWITVNPPIRESVELLDPIQSPIFTDPATVKKRITKPEPQTKPDPEPEPEAQFVAQPESIQFPPDDPEPEFEIETPPEMKTDFFIPKEPELEISKPDDEPFDLVPEKHPDEDRKAELLRMFNYRNMTDPGRIDEVERVPAFKRKNSPAQKETVQEEEMQSRYTLGSDAKLRPNNPYLHDAVD